MARQESRSPARRQLKDAAIFDRVPLNARQLRTVADRRFDDALYLQKSRQNKHANGAMYLAGFVIELRLKARMLENFSWLASAGRPPDDRRLARIWRLVYRSHDLEEILAELTELNEQLDSAGKHLLPWLRQICMNWTVFARYSPKNATMQEAGEFLRRVKELKKWLR